MPVQLIIALALIVFAVLVVSYLSRCSLYSKRIHKELVALNAALKNLPSTGQSQKSAGIPTHIRQ